MKACRGQGRVVVGSDQEALPFAGDGLLANVNGEALAVCDIFLAQNAAHAQLLMQAHPQAAPRLRVAGNARIDTLRAALPQRPKPEPYILINTGLALVTSVWGNVDKAAAALAAASGIDPKTAEGRRELEERVRVERGACAALTALIDALVAEQRIDVVVRPH